MVRRRQHFFLRPLLDHPALQHHDNLVGNGFDGGEIVGDEHVGDVDVVLQTLQQFEDFLGHQLVERRGDLVADDQVGFRRKRPGDADALLLAARELAREAVDVVCRFKLDHLQEAFDAVFLLAAGKPKVEAERPADDLADTLARVQRRVGHLIDHLHTAKLFAVALLQRRRHGLALVHHAAGFGRQQAGDGAGQRAFAATRFAHNGHRAAAVYVDADVL